MSYIRLSVPVSKEFAEAARRLRGWVTTPGFSDLCAGSGPIEVGTLERFYGGACKFVEIAESALQVARGTAIDESERPVFEFDIVDDAGKVIAIAGVQWSDAVGARAELSRQLANPDNRYGIQLGGKVADCEPRQKAAMLP